jgi:hypothetical protein
MNIFVLNQDAFKIPRHYAMVHVNKMLVETCQLLCSVYEVAPYKRTHYKHPCAIWTRTSKQNFDWLEGLGNALSLEYTKRTGKHHASDMVLDWIANNEPELPDNELTPWPQVMPDEYKKQAVRGYDLLDNGEWRLRISPAFERSAAIFAYRRYYASKLRSFRNRGIL